MTTPTKVEQKKLIDLAARIAQKISPLDRDLNAQIIEIVDVLNEAFDLGYDVGYIEGESEGYRLGYNSGYDGR